MPLTLRWKGSSNLPVEGESLRPDGFAGLSADEVARHPLLVGNTEAQVGDLFGVSGNCDGAIILEGDLRHVNRIGRGMSGGSIAIRGDVGAGLGQGMLGGSIALDGSAGDSAGMGMRGGILRIRGTAGDSLGGCEPGARLGMRGGVILLDGDAGQDAGHVMRRGLIAVSGRCGDGLGRGLIAGSLFAFGAVGTSLGLGMKRGTIALLGSDPPNLGPGFAPSGRDRPTFVTIYLKSLREWGFPVAQTAFAGTMMRYNGDRGERGQGEVLVRSESP